MKIKVNKEQLDGRLDNAILETLEEIGILPTLNTLNSNNYDLQFYNKGNRKNGKLFCIVYPLDSTDPLMDIVAAYYISNIYRFNTTQQCTLKTISDKELNLLINLTF